MKQKILERCLNTFFIINCLCLLISVFVSVTVFWDNVEHIHVSWLVWNGEVPYTDFFEHHHPLMWYLFAPVVGLCNRSVFIIFVLRFAVMLVSVATLYVIYRLIKDFVADKIAALLAINFMCFSSFVLDMMVQFKPDVFMQFFFFLGLYFFFAFWREPKQRFLNTAAGCWAVAFLFLQTALFLLLPMGLVGIYMLYKKQITLKNMALAAPWFLVPLLLFVAFMWEQGNLQRYYELNWLLNANFKNIIEELDKADFSGVYSALTMGVAAGIYLLLKKPNKYVVTLLVLYAVEFGVRVFFVSIAAYYFKLLLMYNAILVALVGGKMYAAQIKTAWILVLVCLLGCLKFFLFIGSDQEADRNALLYMQVLNDVAKNTEADDYVLGTNGRMIGVFNKDLHYCWFAQLDHCRYAVEEFKVAEPFNMSALVEQKKPKFVVYEGFNILDRETVMQKDFGRWRIYPWLLWANYQQVKYETLFLRKDNPEIKEPLNE